MINVTVTNAEVAAIKPHPTNDKLMVAVAKSFTKYAVGEDIREAFTSLDIRFLPFHNNSINNADRHTISGHLVYDAGLKRQVVNVTSLGRDYV